MVIHALEEHWQWLDTQIVSVRYAHTTLQLHNMHFITHLDSIWQTLNTDNSRRDNSP